MMNFIANNASDLFSKTMEHLYISVIALIIAIVVSVPLGILLTRTKRLAKVSLTVASVLQTIPTLAVLALMIPLFGVGKVPAIIALFFYVLLPILNNTIIGVESGSNQFLGIAILIVLFIYNAFGYLFKVRRHYK